MVRLKGIERLPKAEQVKIYADFAAHFTTMACLACTDGAKLTFREMARDMDDRAAAVTVFADEG
jgi:hypothetical protein